MKPRINYGLKCLVRLSPLLSFAVVLIAAIALPMQSIAETLRDENGDIMRGTRMVLGKPYQPGTPEPTVENTTNLDEWLALKAMGFNTVRVVWVDPFVEWDPNWTPKPGAWWEVDEVLPYLDKAVENATVSGMNIIINYHHVAEYERTDGFGMMEEFWQKVAPRYKDNDRVYYELNNEQTWTSSDYFLEEFQSTMQRTYEQVRADAPSRHIIMFSFNSMTQPMKAIVDDYTWIDWDYTSVGFHFYGWITATEETELANLQELIENYRTICTEWFYDSSLDWVKNYKGYDVNAQVLEELGQSWIDWRDWNETDLAETRDVLIPDAKAKGYWWGSQCEVEYDIVTEWYSGALVNVTVTNTGNSDIQGYELSWVQGAGENFFSGWSANFAVDDAMLTATVNANYWNGRLVAGGGSQTFGFLVSKNGGNAQAVTEFTLNGRSCRLAK